jgi:3-hydroxyisobutyrate dehydrogenase-like beta-hydroxyacid dehydrogenase
MLPNSPEVKQVVLGKDGILEGAKAGLIVADMSSIAPLASREVAAKLAEKGVEMLDAPVSGGQPKAIDGTLSVMVGSDESVFTRIKPLLECIASDITHCGAPGTGQAMKLVNNMVLFQNVVALAEALALIGHAGVDPQLAFEVLSKGSADSFALRNHGMKAMLQGDYPERAFSSEYALKDIRYALRLAEEAGLFLSGADNAKEVIKKAIRAGYGKEYFPALAKVIAGTGAAKGAAKKKGG